MSAAAAAPPPAVAASRAPRRPRRLGALALFLGTALFLFGLLQLFELRFATGDVYPFYSTLRSDALGSKAFFAALESLPDGPRVERNYRALLRLLRPPELKPLLGQPAANPPAATAATAARRLGAGDTLFLLGTSPRRWPFALTMSEAEEIEAAAKRGARIVFTFAPSETTPLVWWGQRFLPGDTPRSRRKDSDKEETRKRDGDRTESAKDKQPPKGKPEGGDERRGKDEKEKEDDKDKDRPEEADEDAVNVVEHWAIDFRRALTEADAKADAKRQRERAFPAVPARGGAGDDDAASFAATLAGEPPISWHSAADFELSKTPRKTTDPPKKSEEKPTPPSPATTPAPVATSAASPWRARLLRDDRPVLVERAYPESGGSIVLASDSFFLSNEALRTERHPALLAWLVNGGSGRREAATAGRVIFDESHLGQRESPGLMTLARRYRLGGVIAALALLAGLFIWKSVSSLAPPRAETGNPTVGSNTDGVAGRAATAGFSSLLRRGVPAADLLEVCVARWQAAQAGRAITTASGGHGRVSAEKVERLQAIAAFERAKPARARAPATAYRAMCEVLKRR